MGRVVDPLRLMGAAIASAGGKPPLDIRQAPLHGITYRLPVDSAQVKSAVLLAGLFAEGRTTVVERAPTRDHTERMLRAAGVPVWQEHGSVSVDGDSRLDAFQCDVPGDPSSAFFLLAAGVLTGGSVRVPDLCLNPTRLGFARLLQSMGAGVETEATGEEMGEPVGALRVSGAASRPSDVTADDVPALVDELPLVALMATQAQGETVIRGAQELRVKETDRIETVVEGLTRLGAVVEARADGFVVQGPTRLRGTRVRSHGDHRLAMMLAVAGLIADGETIVEGVEAAAVSFPGFAEALRSLGGQIDAG
jgi:3-phosphoshikimate 1-carboxyvinyltransferase